MMFFYVFLKQGITYMHMSASKSRKNMTDKMVALLLTNIDAFRAHISQNSSSGEKTRRYRSNSFWVVHFKQILSAAKSSCWIRQCLSDSAVSEYTARHSFQMFRSEELLLCDEYRSDRLHVLDEVLKAGHFGGLYPPLWKACWTLPGF